jgi:hypothetical protein
MILDLIALVLAALAAVTPPCAHPPVASSGALFYLESPSSLADQVTVYVCLTTAQTTRVTSAHLALSYDSLGFRVTQSAGKGRTVVNARTRGAVTIAVSATNGISTGTVASLVLRRLRPAADLRISARVVDAKATESRDVGADVQATGISTSRPQTLHALQTVGVRIDSITPRSAALGGDLIAVTVYGSGFTPTKNQILLNNVVVSSISSANSTSARFIVPRAFPSKSEAPPALLSPGEYTVQLTNAEGTSNTVKLVLRNPR